MKKELAKELNRGGGIPVDIEGRISERAGFGTELDPDGRIYLAVHRALTYADRVSSLPATCWG